MKKLSLTKESLRTLNPVDAVGVQAGALTGLRCGLQSFGAPCPTILTAKYPVCREESVLNPCIPPSERISACGCPEI